MGRKKAKEMDNGLLAQAKVVKHVAYGLGEELVSITLKNAKTTQNIFEKVLKGGVTIFGMQQRYALDTIEKVASNEQLQKMVQVPLTYINRLKDVTEDRVEDVKDTVEDVIEDVQDTVEDTIEDAKEALEDVKENFEKVAKKAKARVAKTKAVTTKKVKAVKAAVKQEDDLTKIVGVGAKTAQVLVEAGYVTYASIADANKAELVAVLEKAGGRIAKMDPTTWKEQAVFAASGDWASLKNWNK